MSKTWSTMDIGRRSMMNSKSALHTVSHNIANKHTEGYSRQRVDIQTNTPIQEGKFQFGMGAKPVSITRTNNQFIEKKIEQESNALGEKKMRSESLGQLESVFNEQINKGLNKFITDFFNAFREMSHSPEDLAARTHVVATANAMTEDFRRVSGQLDGISDGIDAQIKVKVNKVNEYVKEIAELNGQIANVEITGAHANDQRDRRDLLIKKLGQVIDIKYAESRSGQLTITAANTVVLASGTQYKELQVFHTPASKNKKAGQVEIYYPREGVTPPLNVTNLIRSGELHALIDSRQNLVGEFEKKIDELAYTVGTKVNEIHFQGFNLYDKAGNFFFKSLGSPEGAAKGLDVMEDIKDDVGIIAAAATPFSPGDNRTANLISLLQFKETMAGGTASLDEFYGAMVAETGTMANRAHSELSTMEDSLKQLHNLRESISGVSIDEETAKMIEYQKMFDASARIIRTVDEMLETVLRIKPI